MSLSKISTKIDQFTSRFGSWTSWISLVLVVLICIDVFMRYLFNSSETWIVELEWHLFGLLFLFAGADTWLKDKHVRVDLFYANWSERNKAIVNLIGTIIFAIPWFLIVIYTSYHYSLNSLSFLEGSPNPNGLPARYVIKFCITASFILLLIQAISNMIKDFNIIWNKSLRE